MMRRERIGELPNEQLGYVEIGDVAAKYGNE